MNEWLNNTLSRVKIYFPQVDDLRVEEAYNLSEKVYQIKKEKNLGTPIDLCARDGGFVFRGSQIVDELMSFQPDEDTIISALLYDVMDEGLIDFGQVREQFDENVRDVLEGLGILKTIKVVGYKSSDKVELLRKLFLVMAKDMRVLIIFLAVKVVQMRMLDRLSNDCRLAFSEEVSEIFVPIASILGIYRFKTTLEDFSFKYLHPDDYKYISEQMDRLGQKKKEYIDGVCEMLQSFYEDSGFVGVTVSGRLKSAYSIYNKMKAKGLSTIEGIYDIFAVRIVVPSEYKSDMEEDVSKIYAALGFLHSKWRPVASRFKDFIAVPKPNGYMSLHTTVVGLSAGGSIHPVEVQIRSTSMHEEAEYGIASHWLYKDLGSRGIARLKSHLDWLKNLASLHSGSSPDEKTLESFKLDVFGDKIYVLTPRGDIKELSKSATPLDFAYLIHTDIGHRCVLAKVNGRPVPLDTPLENGDTVEIVTRKENQPKLEWLSVVKTGQAKTKIRSWFADQDHEKNIKRGRNRLNGQLQRFGKPMLNPQLSILKDFGGENLNLQEREKILEEIGRGTQLVSSVVRKLYSNEELLERSKKKETIKIKGGAMEDNILLGGVSGLRVKIANCCTPSFGDDIVGYVSSIANAATIHKSDCPILKRLNSRRIIPANFKFSCPRDHKSLIKTRIRIDVASRVGLLRDVGSAIASNGVNISNYSSDAPDEKGSSVIYMGLDVENIDQFEKVLDMIESIPGVKRVIKVK